MTTTTASIQLASPSTDAAGTALSKFLNTCLKYAERYFAGVSSSILGR